MSNAALDDELPMHVREALLRAGVVDYAQLEALFAGVQALRDAFDDDPEGLELVMRRTSARGPFRRPHRCPWCSRSAL